MTAVTLTSGFLNSSLMTGFTGAAFDLAIVFTGEADFFTLSDLLGYSLAGDSDFTAAALFGRTSLASTLTSALVVFLAGLASFFSVDGFRVEPEG